MRLITCILGASIFAGIFTGIAQASDISVIGLFPGKAVLVVDGASPKTYSVGNAVADGVKLVAVDDSSATIDTNGKKETILIGEHINRAVATGPASVILRADSHGHFVAQGQINGGTIRMLVDTGATAIALSSSDAIRLGINYRKGKVSYVNTANGTVPVYVVQLDTVRIGDIELNQVTAMVQENGLPFALLGMSFLNRTEMRREGDEMTLTKRY